MRLIDADALRAEFKTPTDWLDSKQVFTHVTGIWAMIDHAPTVEPERQKGEWVRALDGIDGHVRCSKCFKIYDWDMQAQYYDYCPNCGAKMEGEDDGTD